MKRIGASHLKFLQNIFFPLSHGIQQELGLQCICYYQLVDRLITVFPVNKSGLFIDNNLKECTQSRSEHKGIYEFTRPSRM